MFKFERMVDWISAYGKLPRSLVEGWSADYVSMIFRFLRLSTLADMVFIVPKAR